MTVACSSDSCIMRIFQFEAEALKVLVIFYITPIFYFGTGFVMNMRTIGHKDSVFGWVKDLFVGKESGERYERKISSDELNRLGDGDETTRVDLN